MKIRIWISLFVLLIAAIFVQAQDFLIPDTSQLVPVAVAKEEMLRGTIISEEMVTTIYVNSIDFDSNWVSDASAIIGQYSNGDLQPYQPIVNADIQATNPVNGSCTLPARHNFPVAIPMNQLQAVKELNRPIDIGLRATLLIEANITGATESIFVPVVEDIEILCRTTEQDGWIFSAASTETSIYLTQMADAGVTFYVAPLVPINIHGE